MCVWRRSLLRHLARQPRLTLSYAVFWMATINYVINTAVFSATVWSTAMHNDTKKITTSVGWLTSNCSHPCREWTRSSWNHPWSPGSERETQDKKKKYYCWPCVEPCRVSLWSLLGCLHQTQQKLCMSNKITLNFHSATMSLSGTVSLQKQFSHAVFSHISHQYQPHCSFC